MQNQNVLTNRELRKFTYCEYLNSMSVNELAYWLINSFTPERYRNPDDVIDYAIRLIYYKSDQPELIRELYFRLWEMHKVEPDPVPYLDGARILPFKRAR